MQQTTWSRGGRGAAGCSRKSPGRSCRGAGCARLLLSYGTLKYQIFMTAAESNLQAGVVGVPAVPACCFPTGL